MLNIDVRSSQPIYDQIIEQVKENIVKGIFQPGDKLPSVQEMSSLLTINPNTVSKAYQELERSKVIEIQRGRGTFIAKDYRPEMDEERLKLVKDLLKKAILESHYMGLKKREVIGLIDETYKELGVEE
ncbi:MAG: GntR family transcriptional regulator [Clostridia bacterium]|nr:GntR family transcriptional regulator [Clostridia bacterium]